MQIIAYKINSKMKLNPLSFSDMNKLGKIYEEMTSFTVCRKDTLK